MSSTGGSGALPSDQIRSMFLSRLECLDRFSQSVKICTRCAPDCTGSRFKQGKPSGSGSDRDQIWSRCGWDLDRFMRAVRVRCWDNLILFLLAPDSAASFQIIPKACIALLQNKLVRPICPTSWASAATIETSLWKRSLILQISQNTKYYKK